MSDNADRLGKNDRLIEDFLRYLHVERNASARTLKAYRQSLTAAATAIGKPWKKCATDDFRDHLFAIMKRGQARSRWHKAASNNAPCVSRSGLSYSAITRNVGIRVASFT